MSYRSVEGNEFFTTKPYSVCYENDTEWDDENDRPVVNATFEAFQTAVNDCGGQINITEEMVEGLVLYDYNEGKDRLRVWEFGADGVVTRTEGSTVKTWDWSIDENGYIFVDIEKDAGDILYIALMGIHDDKYSLKIFSQWPAGGELIGEIYGDEYFISNPKALSDVN
ncbi:hypothetical protein [Vibrio variabilis]|uniref:hypothetical protein n=1 Tax=Vibrio variabilis TaxID=990271 RepID=UPI001EFA2120|nr:hypothetical protein [Vibrio variabilis]